jgi:hypothetical protein
MLSRVTLTGAAGRGSGCAPEQARGCRAASCWHAHPLRSADAHAVQERLSAAALRCSARRCGARLRTLRTRVVVLRLLCAAGGADGEGKPGRRVDLEALRRNRAERPPAARQPPTPPRYRQYASNLGRTNDWTVALNAEIQACASAEAVLDLVAPQLERLSAVNACTALITIQRRARGPATWLQDDARFAQLLDFAARVFERMGPRELANAVYACGKLGIVPPADWLERFWHASAEVLNDFVPQGFSNTFYACGQLGILPPADWLERFWHESSAKLAEWNAQDFSNTIYACGQLGIKPPADWLERFWNVNALKLSEFIPQALSNTVYACGQLGITPPDYWLERFWHASAATLSEFVPQALSNTLYACGQLGITPPDYWLLRFWHASAATLGDFVPQALSNTLYACGQLGIAPPADWLERFWHASAVKLSEFDPQGFSNTLYACGQLSITPPADWLQCFSSSCERTLPYMVQQNLANAAVALATLALWELPLWRGLWERLCSSLSRNVAGWSAENRLDARQMYQAYQAAAVERPGLLPAPSPELLAAARETWIDQARDGEDNTRAGKLQAAVSDCLTRMGVAHANERWCERAERSVDIVIEGATPIALEVDGPSHFLQDGRPDGSTLLRNRILAAHGWRMVVVDYRVWQHELKTGEQREQYLRSLLA